MLPVQLPEKFMPVTNLGSPVDVFAAAKWKMALKGFAGLLLLAFAVASPLLAAKGTGDMTTEWYIAGAVALLMAIGTLVLVLTRSRNVVVVYEEGFAVGKGSRMTPCRWDEVSAMTAAVTRTSVNFIPVGTTRKYTLDLTSGGQIVLGDSSAGRVEKLADHIQGQVMPRLFDQYAEAYNRGEQLQFGPVAISQTFGIQHGKKQMTWEEVESVGAHDGQLALKKRGGGMFGGMNIAISTVPNFEVLYLIISHVLGLDQGEE